MKDGNLWQQVECQVRRADAAAVFMRDCPLLECPRTPVTGNPDNRCVFNAQREARSSEHISALAMRQTPRHLMIRGMASCSMPIPDSNWVMSLHIGMFVDKVEKVGERVVTNSLDLEN